MKTAKRRILWGALLALVAISGVLVFMATLRPVRLELVDHYPAKRIQFVNDAGRALNFFFFTELKSNGIWIIASPQPKGARRMNYVRPHSVGEFEIAPEPGTGAAWRVGFGYQPALPPRYLIWANKLGAGFWLNRFGLLKNYRDHYFDLKTVYAEFAQ